MDADEGFDEEGGSVVFSLPAINNKPLSTIPIKQGTVIPCVTEKEPPIYDNNDDKVSKRRATTGKSTKPRRRNKQRFPRIVLRNTVGKELDTDTVFQRAIYEARWRVANRNHDSEPPGPEEWRLPHAPLPARPDYSRQPAKMFPSRRLKRKTPVSESLPVHLSDTVDVEQLRFLPEGNGELILRSIEEIPALAALGLMKYYDGKNLPSRRYIPFAGVALMHDKMTSSTDKRETIYSFPGFCSGCQRAGFCYGCEKERGFHVHQDKIARTGGGFTYFKRDHPSHQFSSKHPLNWRGVTLPLTNFYDDETYAELQKLGIPLPTADERGLTGADKTSSILGVEGVPTMMTFEGIPGHASASMTDLLMQEYGEEYNGYHTGKVPPSSRIGVADERGSTVYGDFMNNGEIIENQLLEGYREGMTVEEIQELSRQQQQLEDMYKDDGVRDEKEGEKKEKKKKLYKPPKPFKLKSSEAKVTKAESPFTEHRDLNLPKYKQFEVKKSDKETTKFIEIDRDDSGWKEPTKFELKDREKVPIEPWTPPKKKTEVTEKAAKSPPPSQLPEAKPASPPRKEATPPREPTPSPPISRRSPSIDSGVESVPTVQPELPKKKKEPPVKKEKKEPPPKKTRKETPPKPPTPKPPTAPPKEPTPEPIREPTPEPPREPTPSPPPPPRPIDPPPLPSVPPPEAPPLPDYAEPERPKREVSRTLIEAPPPMIEPPKQRRPPPTVKPRRKHVEYRRKRRIPPAAPITKKELKQMADPLDYLAKYCIIHPDRLPHYERVFRKMVDQQQYRYADVPDLRIQAQVAMGQAKSDVDMEQARQNEAQLAAIAREKSWFPKSQLNDHERKMLREMSLITRTATKDNFTTGMGPGDEVVSKLVYTLDVMLDKYDRLNQKLEEFQEERTRMIASKARAQFPQIKDPNYDPPKKGKKKKKKKKNADKEKGDVKFMEDDAQTQKEPEVHRGPPTDKQVLERLDEFMLAQIMTDPDVSKLDLELSRVQEKLKEVDDRIEELEDEKKLMQIYSRDDYHYTQTADTKHPKFLRRQSTLYNKLNQRPDVELNFSELEEALQQINGHLVSEKEYQYIFHILDLPSRRKINLKLFSVVAALSEKVAQVDPLIKKLINKVDFEALSVKMERSRDLFLLLSDQENDVQMNTEDLEFPDGQVKTNNLAVELTAGGVTQEHVQYVVNKFTRNHSGSVDFLDFLTYVPLFIEIHQRIVKDPLSERRDL